MPFLMRAYRFINLLSLDVVFGAIIGALFFARLLNVVIRPYALISLGITVWIIYTADHLRDAKKIVGRAFTERHRFHQQYYNELVAIVAVAIILDAVLIFFIKQQVFLWGVALSVVVFAYLMVQSSLLFIKEVFIAVLYTCGVLLPSVPVSNIQLDAMHYLLILQFALTAFVNLIIFSWFDRELDKREKRHSFVTKTGERLASRFIWLLFVLLFVLSAIQCIDGRLLVPSLVVSSMGLALFWVFYYKEAFANDDVFRLVGDAVFLLPLVYLFFV